MSDTEIKVGSKVRSHVTVCGVRHATHNGIVKELRSGIALVDRGSLHGCAPWEVWEALHDLTIDEPAKETP